ncbi:nickel/cobalt transporter [Gloeocapsopsis dulcis]|uniref:ABC transporter permease n=1 Tax=Gloeocapsopsis dulcis AAB1 = 1H9 TaxID=1433147 RepID=A0A6N8FXI9_9CHRO|nr:sulfite exporter TauE/SafE family protein [Gloeocapsopsis dulcis]MUL37848.1 ABC transporter permease [Gloeocapsopsis dulcis AAB1 = 1H9]WNN89810.1 sulfite exporter TauE/SafE family protein [Gloeocapsopsis dulcis]
MTKWHKYRLFVVSFFGALLLTLLPTPSLAHWADLAVAEIVVGETQTMIALTFPTGLVAWADVNQDGKLSSDEFQTHQAELQAFLSDRIRLTDGQGNSGIMHLTLLDDNNLVPNLQATANTHSTLQLAYSWSQPVSGLKINYNLFLPAAPAARSLATIFYAGQVQNHIFSPYNQQLALMPGALLPSGSFFLAIAASFVWGAMHAMSPGHGKTVVGAYLVGTRATAQHALFLGLTTTITHTLGVFVLGLVTLFASQYILPEQLSPWLSCLSGIMVVAIGLNLFFSRMRRSPHDVHTHSDQHHSHHDHHHDDEHAHSHSHGHHSHLPPENLPITWRSLLVLGISGGLVPCPSALVVLLSAIALGRIGFGLVLVLAFSFGLAGVLIAIGLLLVRVKRVFKQIPTHIKLVRFLPAISALFVALLGVGITTQAVMQIRATEFTFAHPSSVASVTDSEIASPPDSLLCYMQTANNRTINLNALCQKQTVDENLSPSITPGVSSTSNTNLPNSNTNSAADSCYFVDTSGRSCNNIND